MNTAEFFFVSLIISWVALVCVAVIPDNSNYNLVHNALEKCEKNLPRNQKCVITAIPEVKNDN